MHRGKFSDERYEEIKQEVLFMFEETGTDTYPINPFEIARRLKYVVRKYSELDFMDFLEATSISAEGFSRVEVDPQTGMNRYVIYYNDDGHSIENIRWTMFHEIGHVYLGHHDNQSGSEHEEDEANFFAKYAIAPPPLIQAAKCTAPADVSTRFLVSNQASGFVFDYFQKWLHYGPRDYLPYELKILSLFHQAA